MRDVYLIHRKAFRRYRILCDIGQRLTLIYPYLKDVKEKNEVKEKYTRGNPDDIHWLKDWLKKKESA